MVQAVSTELTPLKVQQAVNAIFEVLGEPTDEWQHQALEQYKKGDAIAVKKINASHLRDYYCKCLGCFGQCNKHQPQSTQDFISCGQRCC